MEKRRNQLILSLLNKNRSLQWWNAIDFRWSDVKEEDEEDFVFVNFIESLKKQANEEIFPKK